MTPYGRVVSEDIIPPASGLKRKPASSLLDSFFFFILFSEANDRSNTFFRNIGDILPEYTASQTRRKYSSQS
jgi:hypothetical protein